MEMKNPLQGVTVVQKDMIGLELKSADAEKGLDSGSN